MNPKYRSVSLRFDTLDKVGNLSKSLIPGVNLSLAKTIEYAVDKTIGDKLGRSNRRENGNANVYTHEKTPD
mgnify:CR=1 FL=1|jgi:hypothetical protein|tara:strand:- start:2636 stop:2848 length:213 start_codon:yes stop_codon:yes gene_type:complete